MKKHIQGPPIANTIPQGGAPSLFGHWFLPELKPLRDAAREAARATGYYNK